MEKSFSRRLLTSGVALAVAGAAFALFGPSVLIEFGATVEQDFLFTVVGAVSRVLIFFGLPLSAGLICLSIALSRPAVAELSARLGAGGKPDVGSREDR